MRKLYWYVTAYLKKHGWVLLLSLLAALFFFSILLPRFIDQINIKPRRFVGLVGTHTIDDLPEVITQQLSAGLTSVQPDGSVEPLLAERWIVDEGMVKYTFILKSDIFWQDGTPLTVTDLNYSYPDVTTTTTADTITYTLPEPFSPFPAVVSQPLLRTAIKRGTLRTKQDIIGIGTTRLVNYREELGKLSQVVLDTPTERVIYRFYATEEEAVIAFKHGKVDTLTKFSQSYDLENWPTLTVSPGHDSQTHAALFFNTTKPSFTPAVRQGLAFAIDKSQYQHRAYGPISKASWAYLPGLRSFEQDVERAVERLTAEQIPERLSITLESSTLLADEAEKIKSEWELLGDRAVESCMADEDLEDKAACHKYDIEVSLRLNNFPDTQNFDVLLAAQTVPPDPDQYALWHSAESTNFTRFQNTRIDKLLEEGRQTLEQQRRKEVYQEFQQFFLEEVPAIFLFYLPTYDITRT